MFRFAEHSVAAAIVGSILIAGCFGDDPPTTPPPPDSSAADSLAAHWMQQLADLLGTVPDMDDAELRTLRFDDIRGGFEDALEEDDESAVANLGMGMVEVLELNYDGQLWDLIDAALELGDEADEGLFPGPPGIYLNTTSPILGNQYTLLATAPLELSRLSMSGDVPADATIGEAQELIRSTVIPTLVDAIDHVDEAAGQSDDERIRFWVDIEEDHVEIDRGELLAYNASLRAALAAFRILVSYDFDLPGLDGTNGWMNDFDQFDDDECNSWGYFESLGGDSLKAVIVEEYRAGALRDSTIVRVVLYNLDERTAFLSLAGDQMSQALLDVRASRDNLAEAVASIRAEEGEDLDQSDDAIKTLDLLEIDDSIRLEDDKPKFAEGFETIEDVLNWLEELLAGSYTMLWDETISFELDVAGFMQSPPADLNDLLPYYRSPDVNSAWLAIEDPWDWSWWVDPAVPFCVYDCSDTPDCRTGVVEEEHIYREWWMEAEIELLDGPGGAPIDIDVERVPYFPDYTFGGLFPGADRQFWLDMEDAE